MIEITRKHKFATLILLLVASVFSLNSFAGPLGNQFRINDYAVGNQHILDAATGANGDSIVIWRDSARGSYIFMQRYNQDGLPLQSTDWYLGSNIDSVAIDGRGNYAVARTDNDGSGTGVFVTIYRRDSSLLASEFRVNDSISGDQGSPSITMNQLGEIAISWTSFNGPQGIPAVYTKRYNAIGQALSNQILASSSSSNYYNMGIAIDGFGSYAGTWYSEVPSINFIDVWTRRFTSYGSAINSQTRANTYTESIQAGNDIAMADNGSFVVTWESYGQEGTSLGIYGQRFNANGSRAGNEFHINNTTIGTQQLAKVAMKANGDFVVVWVHDNRLNDPGMIPGIYGREFYSDGQALNNEFLISDPSSGLGFKPHVGLDNMGNYLVAWRHYNPVSTDVDVYGRRYTMGTTSVTTLINGEPVSNLSGSSSSWQYFKITVPAGQSVLDVTMTSILAGDADIYVRYGSLPTLTQYDARPWLVGSNERVQFTSPAAGEWYIGINGYNSYDGVTLTASH